MTKPRRIVSMLSSATEMLYAIGVGDRVVGVSHECDYPPEVAEMPRVTTSHVDDQASSGHIDGQVREMVVAGAPLYGIDEAALRRLDPHLIVTQAQCDVCAVKYDDVTAAVQRIDADHTISVVALNPQSLADIFDDILRVGESTGSREPAASLVLDLRNRVAAVRNKTSRLGPAERPRVAIVEWIDPLMVAANWMPELLQLAGGRCELTEAGRHSTYTEWQDVIRFDPEVIVISPCGFDLPRTMVEAPALWTREGWRETTAVRTQRVYVVDGNAYFNRSGPRIVDSLEILAHLIHPALFEPPLADAKRRSAWCRCDFP